MLKFIPSPPAVCELLASLGHSCSLLFFLRCLSPALHPTSTSAGIPSDNGVFKAQRVQQKIQDADGTGSKMILPGSTFHDRLFNVLRLKKLATQSHNRLNPDARHWELVVASNRHKKRLEARKKDLESEQQGRKAVQGEVEAPTLWFIEEDFNRPGFEASDDVKQFFGQSLKEPQHRADESAQQAWDKAAYEELHPEHPRHDRAHQSTVRGHLRC